MQIPFFRPQITRDEKNNINQILDDPTFDAALSFENEVANFFNSKYAISTNNGTTAQHLALRAMDIKRADKIICSVNSFPGTAEVIRHFDAEPIFTDINESDFNMNIESLEAVLQKHNHKKLKAIFVSHIAGQSADLNSIYELAKKFDLKVIDDASNGVGAMYNNVKIGSINDSFISTFQLNPQFKKAVATAGFFTTNDDNIALKAKLIRNHAIVTNTQKDGSLDYIYDVVDIGEKYDLNGICAAFASSWFKKIPNFIKRRKKIAQIYNEELKNCPHITTPVAKKDHIYTQYIIKIDRNRDDFARKLKEVGVNVSLHYIPLYLLSYYKQKYGHKVNDFPIALKTYQQILSLPIYADLSDEEAHYVCEKVKFVASKHV